MAMAGVDERFRDAPAPHESGGAGEAESTCRRVLPEGPSRAGARRLLGVARPARGRPRDASRHIGRAWPLFGSKALYDSSGDVPRNVRRHDRASLASRDGVAVAAALAPPSSSETPPPTDGDLTLRPSGGFPCCSADARRTLGGTLPIGAGRQFYVFARAAP